MLLYKPDHANAWINLGVQGGVHVNGAEYDKKMCYQEALRKKPDYDLAWYNLGTEGGGHVNGDE